MFNTEEEMNVKEKEIVTPKFCLREDTYNICEGGQGGFSYINTKLSPGFLGKHHSDKTKTVIKEWQIKNSKKIKTEEYCKQMSLSQKKRFETSPGTFLGKTHSDAARTKMSIGRKGISPWNKGILQSEQTKEKIKGTLYKNLESYPHVKLKNEQVLKIKKSVKSNRELSEIYDVSTRTIVNIRAGRTWRHL